MCGITGVWRAGGGDEDELSHDVTAMARSLNHRGPDDEGIWVEAPAGLALGFRRLAILDLSPTGHQPMVSQNGRFVIVFNGEIYNYKELGADLAAAGVTFRGCSDSEVVLEGIARWGVEGVLPRLWGMFAIAVWDRERRVLALARDRLGKKPLFYGRPGSAFLFGSELKALRAHGSWSPSIQLEALTTYLRFACVPAPMSIYRGVIKLPPGCWTRVEDGIPGPAMRYWCAEDVARREVDDRMRLSDPEASVALERLLGDAVARRMVADVPLGAFLSGGIDSSVVVALMQARSARPVKTFTVGFRAAAYDEAPAAATVARHLGTEHTELYVTPEEARAVIPQLPEIYDEPFADSSQIPTFLVSRLARRHVTVALSGDGGDELFGGYVRHQWSSQLVASAAWVPLRGRRLAAKALGVVSPAAWDRVYGVAAPLLPARLRHRHPGDKIRKLAGALCAPDARSLYRELVSQWRDPEAVVIGGREAATWADGILGDRPALADAGEESMLLDLVGYLPDDILTKLDRASMATGLEARCPLLDHRLVEWAWRLPLSSRIRHGQGKWLLRQVLYRYVPVSLVERPKTGFGMPIGDWLRGPLREWAEALLDESALRREGFLDAEQVRVAWRTHLGGTRNLEGALWTVLMFQAWLHRHLDQESRTRAPTVGSLRNSGGLTSSVS